MKSARLATEGENPVPAVDGLIAATALRWGLSLVTRNESDFVRTKVQILNPWRA